MKKIIYILQYFLHYYFYLLVQKTPQNQNHLKIISPPQISLTLNMIQKMTFILLALI